MIETRPITTPVVDYDPSWPDQYLAESQDIASCISEYLEIHHVGSTSIPGLSAKPEIDVLVVVPTGMAEHDYSSALLDLGYRRGGDLSRGHQFYKKEKNGVRTHKLHICVDGHPKVREMLLFRDYLINNEDSRNAYQELKLNLACQNIGISEYLDRKSPFIKDILSKCTGAS